MITAAFFLKLPSTSWIGTGFEILHQAFCRRSFVFDMPAHCHVVFFTRLACVPQLYFIQSQRDRFQINGLGPSETIPNSEVKETVKMLAAYEYKRGIKPGTLTTLGLKQVLNPQDQVTIGSSLPPA